MMLKQPILVVDEQPQELQRYRSILASSEDPTTRVLSSANSAADALELASAAIDSSQGYALAIINLHLSTGMDGISAAQALRRLDDTIMIIFIADHNNYRADEIDRQLGHDIVFLNKPVSDDELRLLTRNTLEQWQQNKLQRSLSERMAKQPELDASDDQLDIKMLAELSQALSTVEQNMVVIRHEDEQIQQLHSRLQQALGDQYPSSEELDEVQQALQLALQKYRKYCASPELLSAVMRLRRLQKKLPT